MHQIIMVDFNLNDKLSDEIVLGQDLQLLLQQVDLLFGTEPMDVLGDVNYGTCYDRYVYSVGISNRAIESKIMRDLRQLELFGFEPSVEVTLLEGTTRDIALIDITFTGEYESTNKTYIIK